MLEVMQAFVKDKGGSARQEEQRREAGNMRMARSFRKWVLHVWELDGPSETWNAQLENFYGKQPVFALIGGLGDSSWRPVHEFSERLEIPSVFPLVDQPVTSGCEQLQPVLHQRRRTRRRGTGKVSARAGRIGQGCAGISP